MAHHLRKETGIGVVPQARTFMDYIKPVEVVTNMIKAGEAKAAPGPKDLLIRSTKSMGETSAAVMSEMAVRACV